MHSKTTCAIALFVSHVSSIAGNLALAQAPAPTPPPTISHLLTAADADAWLDGYLPYALRSGDVAGAVVAIVKDGEVLTEKGYGYADVEKQTPVDPRSTLFRFGSTSKLFTWTAVMQLVEQRKIDLDADVNQYLDFAIPARDGKPVTMRNLMTHTAGFEERLSGLIGVEADGVMPLDQFLKSYIPPRLFAPGGTPAYSNYGAALAGYIVARISGLSFDDYIDQYLLKPLAMANSTFRQPVDARLRPHLSQGYAAASLPPRPFEIVGPAPAGSLSSTGDDMTHFMIAHLQNGRYGTSRILDGDTAQQMHTTALTILPGLNRMLLGFYEDNINGHRVIAHGGDTQWFHSDLHLFIDDGIGLLLSENSAGKDGAAHILRAALYTEFANRYLPSTLHSAAGAPDAVTTAATIPTAAATPTVDARTAAEHARMMQGRYESSRRVDTTFVDVLYMLGQTTVADNGDGTISVSSVNSPSGVARKWREITPLLWREDQSEDVLAAQLVDGRVTRFSFGEGAPILMYDRVPWPRSGGWWVPVLTVSLAALLMNALAWPISALTRRHYRAAPRLSGRDARAHRWIRIACAAAAALGLGWLVLVLAMGSVLELIAKVGGWVSLLRVLSPVVFVGAAGIGAWHLAVVLERRRRWYVKLWAMLLAAALLALLWAAFALHLISSGGGF